MWPEFAAQFKLDITCLVWNNCLCGRINEVIAAWAYRPAPETS